MEIVENDIDGINYICIDPKQGELLYEYMDEALTREQAQEFERHLLLCFKCQETIQMWETIGKVLPPEVVTTLDPRPKERIAPMSLVAKARGASS